MGQKCKDSQNKTNPGRSICKEWHTAIPQTFKEGKHLRWYAENETFELHKWTGISSLFSSVFSLPCLESDAQREICWLELQWDKGSIPWLLCAPRLIFLTPSCSCSYADLLAIRFATWFSTHAVEGRTLPCSSTCLCSSPHVYVLAKPISFHCCWAVQAWLSSQALTSTRI